MLKRDDALVVAAVAATLGNAPTIDALKSTLDGAAGDVLTITGTNFTATTYFTARFGTLSITSSANPTQIYYISETSFGVVVPTQEVGTITGAFTARNGTGATTIRNFAFAYLPYVDSEWVPGTDPSPGLMHISTHCVDLGATAIIEFFGKPATYTVVSATEITCSVPAGVGDITLQIRLTNPGGHVTTSHVWNFTYTTPLSLAPTLTSVTPLTGTYEDEIHVVGTNFDRQAVCQLSYGLITTATTTAATYNYFRFYLPDLGLSASIPLTVHITNGISPDINDSSYTLVYTAPIQPLLIDKTAGNASEIITVTGTGFDVGTSAFAATFGTVTINSVLNPTEIYYVSPTTFAVIIPTQEVGNISLQLYAVTGDADPVVATYTFSYNPSVDSEWVVPADPSPGLLSISTHNVDSNASVTIDFFGHVAAATIVSSTEITCPVPSGEGHVTMTITIENPNNPTTATYSGSFVYGNSLTTAPNVTTFAPMTGIAGDVLILTGGPFDLNSVVKITFHPAAGVIDVYGTITSFETAEVEVPNMGADSEVMQLEVAINNGVAPDFYEGALYVFSYLGLTRSLKEKSKPVGRMILSKPTIPSHKSALSKILVTKRGVLVLRKTTSMPVYRASIHSKKTVNKL